MIQAIRGTKDTLPSDIHAWHTLESTFRRVAASFGFQEIRTPFFESTELFSRGIGETTDIVGKEMYTFLDQGQNSLTLRPEATASIVRAVIENTLVEKNPLVRLWYMGAMFRQERPQKGRLRQFHQFDAEILGSDKPEGDAEAIALAANILREIGLTAFELQINSLGSTESRTRYREALQAHFAPFIATMSDDSKSRLERNPLRILDSKHPEDAAAVKGAPLLIDYLDESSRAYFERVQHLLTALGIPFSVNPRLVRGLDYYCHTAFEFVTTRLGSQNAIGGGGRYDGLFEQLGGKKTPGIGFAFGIERLLLLLEEEGKLPVSEISCDAYVIALDDDSSPLAMKLAQTLREQGFSATTDALRRSFKAQMRDADRTKARFVAIIGEQERLNNKAILKTMATGEQREIGLDDAQTLLSLLKSS
ncbi:MAG: histidine--tRNA ligase [Candidatus Kapaibacterium sp.]|nr:MAG: histidine--tRNA ligase [Candidatus Kapabacteria bacterium]